MKSFLAEDGEEPELTSEDNEPPHVYDEVADAPEETAVTETEDVE